VRKKSRLPIAAPTHWEIINDRLTGREPFRYQERDGYRRVEMGAGYPPEGVNTYGDDDGK